MIEKYEINISNEYVNNLNGTVYIIPSNSEKGYNCAYSLFIPKDCQVDTTLLVNCCNTGNNVPSHLEEANEIAKNSVINMNQGMWRASNLKMPVLIPLFPRVKGYYTQALGSKVYNNDFSGLIERQEKLKPEERLSLEEMEQIKEQCKDLDQQLVNMFQDSKGVLENLGVNIDDKFIIEGYSAGGSFADGFTALHAKVVKACISGGTGGVMILPFKEINGVKLYFPLGVADVLNFNLEEYQGVSRIYLTGKQDCHDPVMYLHQMLRDENGKEMKDENSNPIPMKDPEGRNVPILDANGDLQPKFPSNYTTKEIKEIYIYMGTNVQERYAKAEKNYLDFGFNAVVKKVAGDHFTAPLSPEYNMFVEEFIQEVLSKEKQNEIVEKTI